MQKKSSSKFLGLLFTLSLVVTLTSCEAFKYKKVDAREVPPDAKARVKKNIEEGRGFRLMGGVQNSGGVFDFASSNELWRASLDTIDFMPLVSANYSGGIIITDWYSESSSTKESVKISIRFLSNEIRADAIDIKVFMKKCASIDNCNIVENSGNIVSELKGKILKTAAIYRKNRLEKQDPYVNQDLDKDK